MKRLVYILLIAFFVSDLLAAFPSIPGITGSKEVSTSSEEQKMLDDLLNILKDPKKVKILIDKIEQKQTPKELVPLKTELPKNRIRDKIDKIDTLIINSYENIINAIQDLQVYENIYSSYYELQNEILTLNYYNLLIATAYIFAVIMLVILIEKIISRYSIREHKKVDYLSLYRSNPYVFKNQLFMLLNSFKIFAPTLLPIIIFLILGKFFFRGNLHKDMISLLVILLLIRSLAIFLDVLFHNVKKRTLMKLRYWIKFYLYGWFVFFLLYYIFISGNNRVLLQINLFIFLTLSVFGFFRIRKLTKKVIRKSKDRSNKHYILFLLKLRQHSVTFFHIALTLYVISSVFLDSSITRNLIVRIIFALICLLVIYLIRTYILYVSKKYIKNKIDNQLYLLSISNVSLFNVEKFINFSIFWRFFKALYYIVFALLYMAVLDFIIGVNLIDIVLIMTSWSWLDIFFSISIGFSILFFATFLIVFFVQRKLMEMFHKQEYVRIRKILTLYTICQKPYKIFFVIIMIIVILSASGISISTLLASTGILTLLVAFGMKDILQNFFNAIMFLLEDSFSLDDFIEIDGIKGVVEQISMVYVKLRDSEGKLNMIPFKNIQIIINHTKDYSYALMDIGVAYSTDIDKVKKTLNDTMQEMLMDSVMGACILEDLEIIGVTALAESSVNIRCKIRCVPGKQFAVKHKFLEKVHDNFIKEAISIPYPHSVVILKKE